MTAPNLDSRYDRNFDTLSQEDQKTLEKASVVIIGLGGLGGGVCEMLARTGVGHLTLIDGDVFEVSNLNRQLLSREDLIGTPKAEAARDRIRAVNSGVQVVHRMEYVDAKNLYNRIQGADLAVDCLDSIETRFLLQDAAKKASVPIVSGAIAGATGQVTVIFPEDPGYELIYGDRTLKRSKGVETRTGNLSYCALMVAALQSSECVKLLLGKGDVLRNRLLIADLMANTFDRVDLV